MPTKRRFNGALNFCIPETTRKGIQDRIGRFGATQSEVARKLLDEGIKATENK